VAIARSDAPKSLGGLDFGIGADDADDADGCVLSSSGAIGFRVVTTSRTSIGGSSLSILIFVDQRDRP
jgi:hypothetical protein